MSSISNVELQSILEMYPDDYEVIFEIREKINKETKTSIAYINGIKSDDVHREIRLMN